MEEADLQAFVQAVSLHYTTTGQQVDVAHLKTVTEKLSAVPLFASVATPGSEFMQELSLELELRSLPAGSILIRRGDIGSEMYFLTSGEVEVLVSLDKPAITTLQPGASFGETALISDEPRNAFIRAVSDVEFYTLSKAGLQQTLARFPDVEDALEEDAWQKKSQLSFMEMEEEEPAPPVVAPSASESGVQLVTLQKGRAGFGMKIDRSGVVIEHVSAEDASSPAQLAGVQIGSRIIAVNRHDTASKSS